MKVNVRRPLKRGFSNPGDRRSLQRNDHAAYQEKADDNEEELLKKMQNLVVAHSNDSKSGGAIKRFAAGFKSSSKIKKPTTFAL